MNVNCPLLRRWCLQPFSYRSAAPRDAACGVQVAPGIAALPKVSKLRQEFPAHTAYGQGLTDTGFDLLNRLLTLDPSRRINAKEALCHDWCDAFP